jgi:hypothetical protein
MQGILKGDCSVSARWPTARTQPVHPCIGFQIPRIPSPKRSDESTDDGLDRSPGAEPIHPTPRIVTGS